MKVFISQPMSGKTDEEILNRRQEIMEMIKSVYLNDVEFINSIIKEQPNDDVNYDSVWYLGQSIQKLSNATMAYFDKDWHKTKGCQIEYNVCKTYGIPVKYWKDFEKE